MTQLRKEKIPCPSCKHIQETVLCDSLNSDLNPELREQLFTGKLNVFKCKRCGHEAFVDISLLYHDMKRKFGVWYFPVSLLDQEDFYDNFTIDGKQIMVLEAASLQLFEDDGDHYLLNIHITFDMREMIFYIIFREKLYNHHSN